MQTALPRIGKISFWFIREIIMVRHALRGRNRIAAHDAAEFQKEVARYTEGILRLPGAF